MKWRKEKERERMNETERVGEKNVSMNIKGMHTQMLTCTWNLRCRNMLDNDLCQTQIKGIFPRVIKIKSFTI